MSAENRTVHKTPGTGGRTDIDNSRGYRQIDPRAEHISDQRESNSADNSAGDSARHSTAGIQATPEQAESQAAFTTTGIQTSNSNTGIQSVRDHRDSGERNIIEDTALARHHWDSGLRPASTVFSIEASSRIQPSARSITEIQASDNRPQDSVRINRVLDFGPAKQPVRVSQSVRAIA